MATATTLDDTTKTANVVAELTFTKPPMPVTMLPPESDNATAGELIRLMTLWELEVPETAAEDAMERRRPPIVEVDATTNELPAMVVPLHKTVIPVDTPPVVRMAPPDDILVESASVDVTDKNTRPDGPEETSKQALLHVSVDVVE